MNNLDISKLKVKYLFELSDLVKKKEELSHIIDQIEAINLKLDLAQENPIKLLEHEVFFGRLKNHWDKRNVCYFNQLIVYKALEDNKDLLNT